ncbi:MAG: hypothetical protein WCA76_10560 [Candidatus Sulfotelmatobacter sp.]|jgi:hypothetical protein
MKKNSFTLLFVLLPILAFAGDKHEIEHGRVISQDLNSSQAGTYNAPIGTASVSVPIYRRSNFVVVETDTYTYQWSEVGNKPIILPVNGDIEFYRDGDSFIVLDSKHKKHKFALVGMTAKARPPA